VGIGTETDPSPPDAHTNNQQNEAELDKMEGVNGVSSCAPEARSDDERSDTDMDEVGCGGDMHIAFSDPTTNVEQHRPDVCGSSCTPEARSVDERSDADMHDEHSDTDVHDGDVDMAVAQGTTNDEQHQPDVCGSSCTPEARSVDERSDADMHDEHSDTGVHDGDVDMAIAQGTTNDEQHQPDIDDIRTTDVDDSNSSQGVQGNEGMDLRNTGGGNSDNSQVESLTKPKLPPEVTGILSNCEGVGPDDTSRRQDFEKAVSEKLGMTHAELLLDMVESLSRHKIDRYYLLALKMILLSFPNVAFEDMRDKLPPMMSCAIENVKTGLGNRKAKEVYAQYPGDKGADERIECWNQWLELYSGIKYGIKKLHKPVVRGVENRLEHLPQDSSFLQEELQKMADDPNHCQIFEDYFSNFASSAHFVFEDLQLYREEGKFVVSILKRMVQNEAESSNNMMLELQKMSSDIATAKASGITEAIRRQDELNILLEPDEDEVDDTGLDTAVADEAKDSDGAKKKEILNSIKETIEHYKSQAQDLQVQYNKSQEEVGKLETENRRLKANVDEDKRLLRSQENKNVSLQTQLTQGLSVFKTQNEQFIELKKDLCLLYDEISGEAPPRCTSEGSQTISDKIWERFANERLVSRNQIEKLMEYEKRSVEAQNTNNAFLSLFSEILNEDASRYIEEGSQQMSTSILKAINLKFNNTLQTSLHERNTEIKKLQDELESAHLDHKEKVQSLHVQLMEAKDNTAQLQRKNDKLNAEAEAAQTMIRTYNRDLEAKLLPTDWTRVVQASTVDNGTQTIEHHIKFPAKFGTTRGPPSGSRYERKHASCHYSSTDTSLKMNSLDCLFCNMPTQILLYINRKNRDLIHKTRQIEALSRQIASLKKDKEGYLLNCEQLLNERDVASASLNEHLTTIEDTVKGLSAQLALIQNENITLMAEVRKMEQEAKQIHDQRNNAIDESQKLKKSLNESIKKNEDLESGMEKKKAETRKLNLELATAKTKLDDMAKQEANRVTAQIRTAEEEIRALKEKTHKDNLRIKDLTIKLVIFATINSRLGKERLSRTREKEKLSKRIATFEKNEEEYLSRIQELGKPREKMMLETPTEIMNLEKSRNEKDEIIIQPRRDIQTREGAYTSEMNCLEKQIRELNSRMEQEQKRHSGATGKL
jgi:hypothetical protein